MRRIRIIAALAAMALSTFAQGQLTQPAVDARAYSWKPVTLTAGGFITGIVFSPAEKGLAYCRTDIGGAYRFDAKAGEWVPLLDWVSWRESNLMGVDAIAADPKDPQKVYAALGTYVRGQAAIGRSADRGKTWDLARVPISMGGNEDGRGMGERLAVDPADPRVLYFGSRRDGLWRSTDGAATWQHVESFPVAAGAGGATAGAPGVTWAQFDARASDKAGTPTASVFVGVAQGAPATLYHSADAGKTWQAVEGGPPVNFMPHRAALDPRSHTLYITYGNGPGPNNVTAGGVMRYDIDQKKWTDITPPAGGAGGFGGIALDGQHPGTLLASTIDHWSPSDDLYRSTDNGATWKAVRPTSQLDASRSPFLYWGNPRDRQPRFGWWIAALAVDPFDSNHALYGTGATIWGTQNLTDLDAGKPTQWKVAAAGIEETAVLALISPPAGPHLISGVGDIGSYTHDDLAVSPAGGMHTNPVFTNCYALDFAEQKPAVVLRLGTTGNNRGTGDVVAMSEDAGKTWRPITMPQAATAGRGGGGGSGAAMPAISADGTILLTADGGMISRDKGATWTATSGLPTGLRVLADRVEPRTFYAFAAAEGKVYVSRDAAAFEAKASAGLPAGGGGGRGGGGGAMRVKASFGKAGELWAASGGALYHSTDAGEHFTRAPGAVTVSNFALGKAAPGHDNPAIFAIGTATGVQGVLRSDDNGETWVRINDDQHQYGYSPTVIAGDPRVYGRVYLGFNGRGIVYGEPK